MINFLSILSFTLFDCSHALFIYYVDKFISFILHKLGKCHVFSWITLENPFLTFLKVILFLACGYSIYLDKLSILPWKIMFKT